ncbi:hypothetical protein PT974_03020 [Cladobotryum mycophilum]|uniref:Uncharacterized protein n=1 Tax=Cladobotryum mycophilum TaxID=491253 RepID=A0ABR0SVR9_9HYPO
MHEINLRSVRRFSDPQGYREIQDIWQDTLVQVTGNLTQLEGPNPEWMVDPTDPPDECTPELVSRYKSYSSYAVRQDKAGFRRTGNIYPRWSIREALEQPVTNGAAIDCRLWVAIDWVLGSIEPLT